MDIRRREERASRLLVTSVGDDAIDDDMRMTIQMLTTLMMTQISAASHRIENRQNQPQQRRRNYTPTYRKLPYITDTFNVHCYKSTVNPIQLHLRIPTVSQFQFQFHIQL